MQTQALQPLEQTVGCATVDGNITGTGMKVAGNAWTGQGGGEGGRTVEIDGGVWGVHHDRLVGVGQPPSRDRG